MIFWIFFCEFQGLYQSWRIKQRKLVIQHLNLNVISFLMASAGAKYAKLREFYPDN